MEIIPNVHPIFVHFSVALLPVAALFYLLSAARVGANPQLWLSVANWMLWTGAALTLLTVGSGVYAFNTVNHDGHSHLAMLDHRNWALPTFLLYLAAAAWSGWRARRGAAPQAAFYVFLLLAVAALAGTAWRGGELVYRHGLGVMALPQAEGAGHSHDHADGHSHDDTDGHDHDDADAHSHDGADAHPDEHAAAHDQEQAEHAHEHADHDHDPAPAAAGNGGQEHTHADGHTHVHEAAQPHAHPDAN